MFKLLGLLAALSFAGITSAEQVNIDPSLVHETAYRGHGPGGGGHRGGNPGGGRHGGPGMGGGNHAGHGGRHIGGNPGHRPNPGVRPGNPGHRPNPGHRVKPAPGFNRYSHRGWVGRGHRGYAPLWWGAILAGGYLAWHWFDTTPYGYWQCLAYNRYGNTFPGYGVDANQAATSAIDLCQRSSGYADDSCFIPENYCRVR